MSSTPTIPGLVAELVAAPDRAPATSTTPHRRRQGTPAAEQLGVLRQTGHEQDSRWCSAAHEMDSTDK